MVDTSRTRKFNGEEYRLFDWAFTKPEAQKEKRELQEKGKKVRLTKGTEGWLIWVR